MRVIDLGDLKKTDREVHCPNGGFTSFRFLLARDGMGFSVLKTVIPVGPPQRWRYPHHVEACYCIAGRGILTNLKTSEPYMIEPDKCYVIDQHDDHTFQAVEPTVLISIFNPPLTGTEVHREDHSYAPPAFDDGIAPVGDLSIVYNKFCYSCRVSHGKDPCGTNPKVLCWPHALRAEREAHEETKARLARG